MAASHRRQRLRMATHGESVLRMVRLTYRISSLFSSLGFQACGQLADGATSMVLLTSPVIIVCPTP